MDGIMQIEKSINGRIMIAGNCPVCGQDLGFRRRSDLQKSCKSCSISAAMKGKPSPKKGTKTGKPAWNRKIEDPMHKILRSRLSRRMRHALAGRNIDKNNVHIFNLLGFTIQDLKAHLESQFVDGMSWNNYGEWHIDHKTPDSWFSYSSVSDDSFRSSWSLANLQPLWKLDNLKKGNRYAGGLK
jgi:hypothetical protein